MSPPGGLVRLDDTSLFVEQRGSGPAVIVLHGGPGLDHHVFGDYLDPLAESFRLILVDQRAHGLSERPPERTWTFPRMAQDVIMLARALRIDRYAVLGHSFGGSVALQNAVDYPGMAAAAILSNCVPSGRWRVAIQRNLELFGPAELRERLVRSWARESGVSTQEECAELLAHQLPFFFADPSDPRIQEYRSRIGDIVYSPEMFRAASAEGVLKIELEDRLAEVAGPTLVLTGRYDRARAPEASEAMARAIGGSELHVFEGSGHMPFVEERDGYISVVRGFLERTLLEEPRSLSR